ncbi:hypothetical protein Csa_019185 [Cucumis sativus]|uniref:Uncharacterized protein n=1 Tax=Cucumis sativus TaxID=3659 RepID=A0A0A0LEY3_CUCSA|nr:hypothetical protein Csa_019185 [Cucumis sativus]
MGLGQTYLLVFVRKLRRSPHPLGLLRNGTESSDAAKRPGNYGAFVSDQAAENRSSSVAPAIEETEMNFNNLQSLRSLRSSSSAAVERHGVLASTKGSTFPVASGSEFRMLQDKSSAIAEAKQDGCTGNFKVLDSPFGNFLLPVIPSSTEFFE